MKKTIEDLKAEAEAFKAAAHREHELVRHWANRAIVAESRLSILEADKENHV